MSRVDCAGMRCYIPSSIDVPGAPSMSFASHARRLASAFLLLVTLCLK
jgi:hypothetical protein